MLPIVRPVFPRLETFAADFQSALDTQVTNHGPFVSAFEQRIAEFCGVQHALAFCNGQTALIAMLRAANLSGEIVEPSYTFAGTAHGVVLAGCRPVFADCDAKTFTLDPASVKRRLSTETTAILAAPVFGNPCDNDALQDVADGFEIPLFYDSASAFGSEYQATRLGTFGRGEIFSFHATKVFSTMEGGALTTNDDAIYARAKRIRDFGRCGPVDCDVVGLNGKMMEVAALVGLRGCDRIDELLDRRQEIVDDYTQQLSQIPGVRVQWVEEYNFSPRLFMAIEVSDAARLVDGLRERGIEARRFFSVPCHRMQAHDRGESLPVTEQLAERVVCLPFYSDITASEVQTVTEAVMACLASS